MGSSFIHLIRTEIEGKKVEAVIDFIFLDSKIIVDGDCSCEIKRLEGKVQVFLELLGKKAVTNLDSILRNRDITLLTKIHMVIAVVFPVVM